MASRIRKKRIHNICSEFSAQRMSHPPNPALPMVIAKLHRDRGEHKFRIADQGCGKLRHFKTLLPIASELILVDTQEQLAHRHKDGKKEYTIEQFAQSISTRRQPVIAMASTKFASSKLRLDIIFCVAVFSVVERHIRQHLAKSAAQNLDKNGVYIVIAPRNDSSILRRCLIENRYKDGHVFYHHGTTTFFANFRSIKTIENDCKAAGFKLIANLSSYRQVCLLFSKTKC